MDKLHFWASAFVAIFLYLEVESKTYRMTLLSGDEEKKMCGKDLVTTLQLVCNGNFNSMGKRSQEEYTQVSDYWPPTDDRAMYPFRSRHLAKALIPGTFRRVTRGVVDECCRKSCTLAEMSGYCAD